MTFNKFLKGYKEDDSTYGDLARDVSRDTRKIPHNTKKAWLIFLNDANASDAALEAFEKAWEQYKTFCLAKEGTLILK